MMATMSSQFGLAVPSTDHDMDMLSDGAIHDVDIDIELDDPSVTGDQDDYMAEDHVPEEENDAEMQEDFDDVIIEEAEMYDGGVDEDDQMVNIDFDQSEHFTEVRDDDAAFTEDVLQDETETSNHEIEEVLLVHDEETTQDAVQPEIDLNSAPNEEPEVVIEQTAGDDNAALQSADQNDLAQETELQEISSPHNSSTLVEQARSPVKQSLAQELGSAEAQVSPSKTMNLKVEHDDLEDEITFDDDELDQVLPVTNATDEVTQSTSGKNRTSERDDQQDQISKTDLSTEEVTASNESNKTQPESAHDAEESYENDDNEEYHEYSYDYDIIVEYGENKLSLFPPTHHHEVPELFLLGDRSLANQNISEVFSACRVVFGDSVSDHQALEIELPLLDLCIHEDSSECTSLSLSQVVDVYYRLHQNDGVEDPVPLTLILKTRTRFSARLGSLTQAANNAQGYLAITGQDEAANHEEEEEAEQEAIEEPESTAEGIEARDFTRQDEEVEEQAVTDNHEQAVTSNTNIEETTQSSTNTPISPPQNTQAGQTTGTIDSANGSEEKPSVKPDETSAETIAPEDDEEFFIDFSDDENEVQNVSTRSSTVKDDLSKPTSEHAEENETHQGELAVTDLDTDGNSAAAPEIADAVVEHGDLQHEPSILEDGGQDGAAEFNDTVDHEEEVENWDEEDEYEESFDQAEYVETSLPDETVLTAKAEALDEDDLQISWDDDEEEGEQAQTKPESPSGKRTFDEHAEGTEDSAFDQVTTKRTRLSFDETDTHNT